MQNVIEPHKIIDVENMNNSEEILNYSSKLHENLLLSNSSDVTFTVLRDIFRALKNKSTTEQEYIDLAGYSGSLLKVLQNSNVDFKNKIESLRCLHCLTSYEASNKRCCKIPSLVISAIQKISINYLKESRYYDGSHFDISRFILSYLSILFNLIIAYPEEVLENVIINSVYQYIFYGVQKVQNADVSYLEESGISFQDEQDESRTFRAYTNRNRRKRLRRKKGLAADASLAFNSSKNIYNGQGTSKQSFVCPKVSSAPEEICLKPQWLRGPYNSIKEPTRNDNEICLKPQWLRGVTSDNEIASGSSRSLVIPSKITPITQENIDISASDSFYDDDANRLGNHLSTMVTVKNKLSFRDSESQWSLNIRIRQQALLTIQAVIDKAEPRKKFSYWPQLMCQSPSLMTCILQDPTSDVRMSALQVVNSFLMDSLQVLSMATEDDAGKSYTTFGKQLGSSIRDLHQCLIRALLSERSSSFLVSILKTLELLVENVKYVNLKPGLLTKTVTHVKYFLRYKDAIVRANAFSFFVSLLMIKPQISELKDLLMRYQSPFPRSLIIPPSMRPPSPCEEEAEEDLEDKFGDVNFSSEGSVSTDSGSEEDGVVAHPTSMASWLVLRCYDSILTKYREKPQGLFIQVQLQSLKVLSALVTEHINVIHSNIPVIQQIIKVCCDWRCLGNNTYENQVEGEHLISPDPEVVIEHAYTLLSALLGSIKVHLEKRKPEEVETVMTQREALQLWLWTLQEPLSPLLTMNKEAQRTARSKLECDDIEACPAFMAFPSCPIKIFCAASNVLAQLCGCVLELIGEELLKSILNTVHYLLLSPETQVQFSGIKIVANIVGYSPVYEHPIGVKLMGMTTDIATESLHQRYTLVNKDRLLASWALANVISVISLSKTCKVTSHDGLVTKEMLMKTLRAAVIGCKDKDKVRPHSVRCLGNAVALIIGSHESNCEIEKEINVAVGTLVECCKVGNNMKMRWNACQSLGIILASHLLVIESASWRNVVLKTLCSLVESFKNYKVRLQAAAALASLRSRKAYGPEFHLVLKSLLRGFEDSQNIFCYDKLPHRDDLDNQLCVTLCLLISLIELEDLESLPETLLPHEDMVKLVLKKAHTELPPERVTCILKASERIKELLNSEVITVAQMKVLQSLEEIFQAIN